MRQPPRLFPPSHTDLLGQLAHVRLQANMGPRQSWFLIFQFFPLNEREAGQIKMAAHQRGFTDVHVNLACTCNQNPIPGTPHVQIGWRLDDESLQELTPALVTVGLTCGKAGTWYLTPVPEVTDFIADLLRAAGPDDDDERDFRPSRGFMN